MTESVLSPCECLELDAELEPAPAFAEPDHASRKGAMVVLETISRGIADRDQVVNMGTLSNMVRSIVNGQQMWQPEHVWMSTWKMGHLASIPVLRAILDSTPQSLFDHFINAAERDGVLEPCRQTGLKATPDAALVADKVDRLRTLLCSGNESAWSSVMAASRSGLNNLNRNELQPGSLNSVVTSYSYYRACRGDRAAMGRLGYALDKASKTCVSSQGRELLATLSESWTRLSLMTDKYDADPLGAAQSTIRESSFDLLEVERWAEQKRLHLPPSKVRKLGLQVGAEHLVEGMPTMRVMTYLGEASNTEDARNLKRYERLLEPMALLPGVGPDQVWTAMQSEFPWMEEANTRLAEAAALGGFGQPMGFRARSIMLSGRPGVGKSRWARRAAAVLGLPFMSLPLGGANSSMLVNGAERGWGTGRPGFAASVLATHGVANPLVLGDEADKAGQSRHNGNAVEAMMAMLAEETSSRYYDTYLMAPIDVSHFNWVFTANGLDDLPSPLLSRCDICHAGKPELHDLPRVVETSIGEFCVERRMERVDAPDITDVYKSIETAFLETRDLRAVDSAVRRAMLSKVWRPPGEPKPARAGLRLV